MRAAVLLVVACLALASPAAASAAAAAGAAQPPPPTTTPFRTPDTSSCPYRTAPPPPVDLSEAPAPGQSTPPPVPTPDDVVGGDRLAGCGLVLSAVDPALPADLTAHAWVVADLDSGAVLAARDAHGRHRAASTIKVLTALVALRELDPAAVVVATDADASQEGSRVGLGPAGAYTVDQLLHGLLLRSGNDAAHALAVALGGVPRTVELMNAAATDLGAADTRVATPSGLDAPGSSTSAYDLAAIFRVAMGVPRFAQIVATRQIDFPGFQDKPGFVVANDNRLLANYPGALGGKTGFTDDARHTFVGAAERGGRRLLVVLLRAEQEPVRVWEQAARLLDYGFALPTTVEPVGRLVDRAPPARATSTSAAPASSAVLATAVPPGSAQQQESRDGGTPWPLLVIVGFLLIPLALWPWARRKAAESQRDDESRDDGNGGGANGRGTGDGPRDRNGPG